MIIARALIGEDGASLYRELRRLKSAAKDLYPLHYQTVWARLEAVKGSSAKMSAVMTQARKEFF